MPRGRSPRPSAAHRQGAPGDRRRVGRSRASGAAARSRRRADRSARGCAARPGRRSAAPSRRGRESRAPAVRRSSISSRAQATASATSRATAGAVPAGEQVERLDAVAAAVGSPAGRGGRGACRRRGPARSWRAAGRCRSRPNGPATRRVADAVEMQQQPADRIGGAPAVVEQRRPVGVAGHGHVLDEGVEQGVEQLDRQAMTGDRRGQRREHLRPGATAAVPLPTRPARRGRRRGRRAARPGRRRPRRRCRRQCGRSGRSPRSPGAGLPEQSSDATGKFS